MVDFGAGAATTDFWEPRRLTSLAAARARLTFVNRLRMGFTAVAAIFLALFVSSVIKNALDREASVPKEIAAEDIVRMVNPRFSGRTANGSAYSLVAETALRRKGNPNIIDLIRPVMRDARGGALSSATGIYNSEQGVIDLTGVVNFADRAGYKFSTRRAQVLLNESRVVGQSAVAGQGPLGSIQSDAYEIRDNGQTVSFSGRVKTRLQGRKPAQPQ